MSGLLRGLRRIPWGPMVATLRRQKAAALLIVIEMAVACAILSNALFVLRSRLMLMRLDSGIAEAELVAVLVHEPPEGASRAQVDAALTALRGIPGVRATSVASSVSFEGVGLGADVTTVPIGDATARAHFVHGAVLLGDQNLATTLGWRLVAGRAFRSDEFTDVGDAIRSTTSVVILTRSMANRLFPGESALGQAVYLGDHRMMVIGLVDHLATPWPHALEQADDSVILPESPVGRAMQHPTYLLRTTTAERESVIAAVPPILSRTQPLATVIRVESLTQKRFRFFARERDLAGIMVGVCTALLLTTALGILGLASYWVQLRTRQIGIRRALGASRADILSYYHLENLLLVGTGVACGALGAVALNLWLMQWIEIERLPLAYMPAAAVVLVLLGQLAVIVPAQRAARVAPVVATRAA